MSRHRDAFEEIAEKAGNELGDSLKELYLYGSVARGEQTDQSDVDILAVVEDRGQKKWLQQKAAEIGVEHGVLASVIVKTGDVSSSRFVEKVREEGIAYV